MNYVEIKNKYVIRYDYAVGMEGFKTACHYAKQFRKSGKARVKPNPEGKGWVIWSILGDATLATVKPVEIVKPSSEFGDFLKLQLSKVKGSNMPSGLIEDIAVLGKTFQV